MSSELKSKSKPLPRILAPFCGLLLAVSFLTRFPLKTKHFDDDFVWKWSLAFYPFCGYLVGAFAVVPLFLTLFFIPSMHNLPLILACIFFYMAALEWLTRMFHFDGFCDCCDAFTAMANKEKRLEIMKDPHVGSSAVGGAVLLITGKILALAMMANLFTLSRGNGIMIILFMMAIPVFGRFAMLCLAAIGRYPREKGTGGKVIGKVPFYSLLFAAISVLPLAIYLPPHAFALSFFFSAFVIFYWKIKSTSKIGGVTGDVLGACCETTELAVAFAFLIASS